MSNQIKLTIDISDELLSKVMTAVALSTATLSPSLGGVPMMVRSAPSEAPERPSMGFKVPKKEGEE